MSPNWGAAVKALTRGAGADDAVLVAGGDSVNQSLEELKIGGNVVIIGCSKTRISQ
jgi:NADPH:quinone reductase-like Zn-dependent oxidoreductase